MFFFYLGGSERFWELLRGSHRFWEVMGGFMQTFRHIFCVLSSISTVKNYVWIRLDCLCGELGGFSWFSWFSCFFAKISHYVPLPSIWLDSVMFSNMFNIISIMFWLCLMIFYGFSVVVGGFGDFLWVSGGPGGGSTWGTRWPPKPTQKMSKIEIFRPFFFDQNVFKHVF